MGALVRRKQFLCDSIIIALLAIGIYSPICNSYFVSDDSESLFAAHDIINHPQKLLQIFISNELNPHALYRPLHYVILSLTYFLSGTQPLPFHAVNVLIHLLVAFLIYRLVVLLLARTDTGDHFPAFLSALLFALHPVHHEAVIWITAVVYPLAAFFYLLSMLAYIKYEDEGGGRHLLLAIASFMFSLATTEAAVSLPLVIAIYIVVWKAERLTTWAQKAGEALRAAWPFLAILGCYFILRRLLFGTLAVNLNGYSARVYSLKCLASDFTRLQYPLSHPGYFSLIHRCLGAIALTAVILIGAIVARIHRETGLFKLIVFGILWQCVALAGLYHNFGFAAFPPRFFYMPSIGACIALGASLWALYLRPPIALPCGRAILAMCTTVLIALYAVGLHLFVIDWHKSSDIALRIKEQCEMILSKSKHDSGERIVLINTPYDVWPAAHIFNRNGPQYFMAPPLTARDYRMNIISLNIELFHDDLEKLKNIRAVRQPIRYFAWSETSGKLIALPDNIIDALITGWDAAGEPGKPQDLRYYLGNAGQRI